MLVLLQKSERKSCAKEILLGILVLVLAKMVNIQEVLLVIQYLRVTTL